METNGCHEGAHEAHPRVGAALERPGRRRQCRRASCGRVRSDRVGGRENLRAWLVERFPAEDFPSVSAMGAILKRRGLVTPRRKRKRRAVPITQPFSDRDRPNRVWCVDFREFGLPDAIRSDNGPPFASTGAGGLTKLSVSTTKSARTDRWEGCRRQSSGRKLNPKTLL